MADGFRAWDASGALIMDITDNSGRVLGSIGTGTANGSVTITGWTSQGRPFAIPYSQATANSSMGSFGVTPDITISGNVLSWSFRAAVSVEAIILYGVY